MRSSKTLVRASDHARIALPSKADFIAVCEGDILEWYGCLRRFLLFR